MAINNINTDEMCSSARFVLKQVADSLHDAFRITRKQFDPLIVGRVTAKQTKHLVVAAPGHRRT